MCGWSLQSGFKLGTDEIDQRTCPLSQWGHLSKASSPWRRPQQHPVPSPLFVGGHPPEEGWEELAQAPWPRGLGVTDSCLQQVQQEACPPSAELGWGAEGVKAVMGTAKALDRVCGP